jgi:hypothetical protein
LRADALPPLRPAAFFWAVVPPWRELLLELEPEPDFLPPRLEAPGEFAIRAARSFDSPFSLSFSYCFSFLTLGRLLGISHLLSRVVFSAPRPTRHETGTIEAVLDDLERRIREVALSLPETYEDEPWGHPAAEEREVAHLLPYVRKAKYVGRYGWVTADVTDEDTLESALEWLRESYWLRAPAELRDAAWGPEDA